MPPNIPYRVERASAGLLLVLGVALFLLEPIAQPQGYHQFADMNRIEVAGTVLPNAANVLSNLAFMLVGGWGLWCSTRATESQRFPLGVFFTGLVLTALGSAFYHWRPSDAALLWDRLPMAVTFSGAISALATERLGAAAGSRWLNLWLCLSLLSLGMWAVAGDLRLYVLVQFGGLLIMVLWLFLRVTPTYARLPWIWLLVAYVVAKIFEATDEYIWTASGQVFAGHALKHLAAAAGIVPLILALRRLPAHNP